MHCNKKKKYKKPRNNNTWHFMHCNNLKMHFLKEIPVYEMQKLRKEEKKKEE